MIYKTSKGYSKRHRITAFNKSSLPPSGVDLFNILIVFITNKSVLCDLKVC